MTADRPLSEHRLADILELGAPEDPDVEDTKGPSAGEKNKAIREAIEQLNSDYEDTNRTFRITKVAGGWQVLTIPEFATDIARLKGARQLAKLSPAAMETLAIIAYRQPILRADLESIRGVACGEILRSLMERRMVKIAGRAEEIGRPMLYGTTREFLQVFGLASLDDLPKTGLGSS
ncbi:MAG: SMC-Scp complex subunit ScpB [Phycisphaerales bacterium]|nr:SMC-Scp complex subunit ScpB [Phycisphaerales bacterium]